MSEKRSPYREVIEEIALAALIVIGHAVLVLLIIGAVWLTGYALASHHEHEPTIYGVSARFLIEGGEIMLIGIVLGVGILSAFLTLTVRLFDRLRSKP